MDLGLRDRVAAVAASSAGLGFAVARELAEEGAKVFICSRAEDRVRAAEEQLREVAGARESVGGIALDLAETDAPRRFIGECESRFGKVDILVANNGGPPPGPPLGLPDDSWADGFRRTFESSRKLAEAVIPGMRERRWGRLLFVTSISVKQPIEGLAISTAMRSAVVGYAKMLSDELARDGITVNCLAPGSTATGRLESLLEKRAKASGRNVGEARAELESQIPARRIGRPEEFAAAVAFLASERASYITGAVLQVDGGVVRSLT